MDVSAEQRKYAKGLAVRKLLIATTQRMLASHGYHGLSIADIVLAAGVTKNQLFHHFGNKEGLGFSALSDSLKQWEDELDAPAQIYPDAATRLEFASGRLEYLAGEDWPCLRLWATLSSERTSLPPAMQEQLDEIIGRIRGFFRSQVKSLKKEGRLAVMEKARVLADLITAVLLGEAAVGASLTDQGSATPSTKLICSLIVNARSPFTP